MTRINAICNPELTRSSIAWGKRFASGAMGDINAYVFAAVLIICSVAVGCSSDKPKPVTSSNQIPTVQPQASMPAPTPAVALQAERKPAPRKAVRKQPATVNYADKTYGVTFEYPRRYAIETGDAATQLVAATPLAMNFVQPGGMTLAAVELPESGYANTDFSSAYFNVSVNKTLTAAQCSEFAVPQSKSRTSDSAASTSTQVAQPDAPKSDSAALETASHSDPTNAAKSTDTASNSKLLVGDMELMASEAVSGEGARQSDSKFFHVYQNAACYEFALNVTTDASDEGLVKHVDRDKVFSRLEQILATVKINAVQPEVATDSPAPAVPATPAQ
jgi:hypothetical protein